MGDIRFLCPECGSKLAIDSKAAGYYVPCPDCGRTIQAWQGQILDIRFQCPACAGRLTVDIAAAGKTTRCPLCREAIGIPEVRSPPRSAPPAVTPPARPVPPAAATLTAEEIAFLSAEPPGGNEKQHSKGSNFHLA